MKSVMKIAIGYLMIASRSKDFVGKCLVLWCKYTTWTPSPPPNIQIFEHPNIPPGNPDHYQALLVLPGGRLLRLHHEGVHPAADVPRGEAHLSIRL